MKMNEMFYSNGRDSDYHTVDNFNNYHINNAEIFIPGNPTTFRNNETKNVCTKHTLVTALMKFQNATRRNSQCSN